MRQFLADIEVQYIQNPYHNAMHAADVTQTVHMLLRRSRSKQNFTELDTLAVLFAAVCHDVGHPGVTNGFRVANGDEGALTYNDRSVNENMHCSIAYRTLQPQGSAFLDVLPKEQWDSVRKSTVQMVLSTDVQFHADHLKAFKSSLEAKGPDLTQWESHQTALDLMLHGADISNISKAMPIAMGWTERVLEEFFAQGDREKEMGLPVSPLCDRSAVSKAGCQVGFANFVVRPTFAALEAIFEVPEAIENLQEYHDYFARELAKEKQSGP